MNKKAFLGLLVTVMMLAVATAGCTFSTTSSNSSSSGGASPSPSASFVPQNNPGYVNYTNATAGVRMQYPLGWNVTEGGSNSTSEAIIATFSGPTGVNLILMSENESLYKISLDEMKNITVSGILNKTTYNYNLVSTEKTTLAGMPAYNLTFAASSKGFTVKQIVVMTEKEYQVYVLSYTALSGVFSDYQNDFSNMTNSFAITS